MKQFTYNNNTVDVDFQLNNIHICDSYKIKKSTDMQGLLCMILNNSYCPNSVKLRGINSLLREWQAHNLCYNLHIKRNHTADVDLDANDKFEPLYRIVGFIYGIFY